MQYKKEEVQKLIIEAAEKEFLKNGYKDASIRNIAKKAGVMPSNIYNYFKNKDELFLTILKPLLVQIEIAKNYLIREGEEYPCDYKKSLEMHYRMVTITMRFIDQYRPFLKLLVFQSYGSSLETYIDEFLDWMTRLWDKQIFKIYDLQLDKFLIHNMVSFFFNSIREGLMHDVPIKKFEDTFYDLTVVMLTGFDSLIDKKRSNN